MARGWWAETRCLAWNPMGWRRREMLCEPSFSCISRSTKLSAYGRTRISLEGIRGMLVGWGGSGGELFKRPEKESVVQCFLPMMRLVIVGAYTRRAKKESIRPAPRSIQSSWEYCLGMVGDVGQDGDGIQAARLIQPVQEKRQLVRFGRAKTCRSRKHA